MVAHTRATPGPDRLRPLAADPIDRSSSNKSKAPQPEAGGLGVSSSQRPARSSSNALTTGTSRTSHEPRGSEEKPPEAGGLGVSPSQRPARSTSYAPTTGTSRPSHEPGDRSSHPSRESSGKGRLRALNLPRALHVDEIDGKPTRVQTTTGLIDIETTRERWRIDDEWWRRPISRMYFQVLLASSDQLTIFKDLETGQWFQQQY